MALFAVNTGLRESNVCGLQWRWEVLVPEIGRSVFVIPPEAISAIGGASGITCRYAVEQHGVGFNRVL